LPGASRIDLGLSPIAAEFSADAATGQRPRGVSSVGRNSQH